VAHNAQKSHICLSRCRITRMIEPTIWPLQPHTRAKHTIMRGHLGGWFPKLAWTGHLLVVDGFAGPGEYVGGEPGSPLHAVQVALTHSQDLSRCKIDFLFIEQRTDRYRHLRRRLSTLMLPSNMTVEVKHGEFEGVLEGKLNGLRSYERLPACFAMIDPFGFGGVPMRLLERLGRGERADLLISFMYESINRFLTDRTKEKTFDSLFGSEEWRQARRLPEPD
jgi:three-Cys-motif partner protein